MRTPSKITKKNSQGTIFAIISRVRGCPDKPSRNVRGTVAFKGVFLAIKGAVCSPYGVLLRRRKGTLT